MRQTAEGLLHSSLALCGWEIAWLGWVAFCFVFFLGRRANVGLAGIHAAWAYLSYGVFRAGVALLGAYFASAWTVLAIALMMSGQAVLFGWAASPGGMTFLTAPIRVLLLRLGSARANQLPFWTDDMSPWSRSSTRMAFFIGALDLLVLLVILAKRTL